MVTNVCWVGKVEPANVQRPTFRLFLKQITNWHLTVLDFNLVLGIVLEYYNQRTGTYKMHFNSFICKVKKCPVRNALSMSCLQCTVNYPPWSFLKILESNLLKNIPMTFRYKYEGFNILENKWMDRTLGFSNIQSNSLSVLSIHAFYFTFFPPKL